MNLCPPTHTPTPSIREFRKCTIMHYLFRMAAHRDSTSTDRLTLLIVGHSFVRRMQQQVCPGDPTQRYYCPDLLLSHMFEKVVFLGKGALTLDGLLREFGAVRAEAPNVVLIDIDLTRFNKICHPSQRPRWQVDKEAIGLSRVQQCSSTYNPPS